MPVSFEHIKIGSEWQREALAELWGYQTFHAIARGVVTPSNSKLIILFVEEAEPGKSSPYSNRLTGRTLHWEGERGHGNDLRIQRADAAGEQIHVFHRHGHRAAYVYQGRARLRSFEPLTDFPSRAEFELPDKDPPSESDWTDPELGVAMNVYCSLPAESFDSTDPRILEVARLLGRTPDAMATKLADFASLNPRKYSMESDNTGSTLREEEATWNSFTTNWTGRSFDSEARLADLRGLSIDQLAIQIDPAPLPAASKEREQVIMQRMTQGSFRKFILGSYGNRCCITGLDVPQLLIAGHIVRWADDIERRADPTNGLCMNALHDKAFECGLITVSESNTVWVSPTLLSRSRKACTALEETLLRYHETMIRLPTRFQPDQALLSQHRERRFRK